MTKWFLRFHILTALDRTNLTHVWTLLARDPHVYAYEVADDPLNPYVVHVEVTFHEGHTKPSFPDLQKLAPVSPVPVLMEIPDLAREAARIESEFQHSLDKAVAEISKSPEVPGWVRVNRWVRHTDERWTARITEIISGPAIYVRYVREDGRGFVRKPDVCPLRTFVESFAPSDKPLPPPSFYQRLLRRRH